MARPTPLSGYPEWLPAERIVEQRVVDLLRESFELHGFASVRTRAVEPLATLLSKGEIDKEVYVVRRLHSDPGAEVAEDALALHYDLTVPFARYVLENAGKLAFPFRRYQIQPAWRGERPQEGRYREFCQADVDIVDRDRLAGHHDVEVAQVMAAALERLPLPRLTMQVNNRKLIEGYYRGIGVDPADVPAVMRVVDKLDKIGPDAVSDGLREQAGLNAVQARACLALAEVSAEVSPGDSAGVSPEVGHGDSAGDTSLVDRVAALGVRDPLLDAGLEELVGVLEGTAALSSPRFRVVADLRIARGLDYYTGTVYETRMSGFESLGSVCSGGRYDALASDGRTSYPGVGVSFGVTRALAPLFGRGLLTATRSTPSCVLVALPEESSRRSCDALAARLRARGIATEVAPESARYGKQIRFAQRRGIPFVWFPADATDSGQEEVRDIRSGEQVPADPASWAPPAEDLRPGIVETTR